MRRDTKFGTRLGSGIFYGLAVATLLSAFVGILAMIRGSDWNPTYEVSTWAVIRGYYFGGLIGGLVFAVLRPLFPGRIGGLLLGMVLGPMVYSAVMRAVDGPEFRLGPAIIAGVLVGGAVGWNWSKPGALG
jgi:hypothetical protein